MLWTEEDGEGSTTKPLVIEELSNGINSKLDGTKVNPGGRGLASLFNPVSAYS